MEDAGGLAVGLMLDMDASEIGSFAITGPMFAGSPEPPIAEVVVLLGGPAASEAITNACQRASHPLLAAT